MITCLLFLVMGIVSAADNNSTDDTLKTDDGKGNEIVEIQDVEVMNENPKATITVRFVNAVTGEEYGIISNTLAQGGSWGIGKGQFNNMIANHKTFKMDGYMYTFTYWSGDNGIVDGTQLLYCTGKDYTATFYANYDKELLGRLTFILNDEHGNNGVQTTYTDEADYKFTFNDPSDVEEGYRFLHYENAKTGEIYNPGDVFSMPYSAFQGQDVTVEMNTIYEKIADDNPVNDTNNTEVNGTDTNNNTNGTTTNNNTTSNETNETTTNNNTDNKETDGNGTSIDNSGDDNKKTNDTDDNIKKKVGDPDKNNDDNITATLSKHKTAIAFTGLVCLVIIISCALIYTRRYDH